MLRIVSERGFAKVSLIGLTLLLVIAAGTVSAVRPLNVFAASTDTCGYNPQAAPSPNPGGGTVIFDENTVTRAIQFYGVGLSGHIGVFANDESGLYIGKGGTPSSAVPGKTYGEAVPPTFGTGVDGQNRPDAPTIYLTDITNDPTATGGDWENGGQPATTGASALYGSWSPTLGTKPVNKNGWTLGPDADPIPATDAFGGTTTSFNEGYGAEVTWNTPGLKAYDPTTGTLVPVQPGHTYRVQSMTHDTDQNHTSGGGDVGEVCTTFHIPVANLSITKTADASPVNAGDPIGFTVEIKNTGDAAADGSSLSDSLPGGSGSGVTWSIDSASPSGKFVLSGAKGSQTLGLASSSIPPGADWTVHITALTSATECGVYDNTATLTSTDSNPAPASAEEVCNPAHVTITKTADASPVNAGDPIGFTVEVKNTGTGLAKGVSLADSLPGGSGSGVTWSIDSASPSGKFVLSGAQGSQTLGLASSTLPAGADYTVHITASTSATECGVYDNTATLTTTNANNPNPASAEEVCNPAHVTITKTADASPVNAGDPIGFTVEVKNTGTGTATGVKLSDSLPGGSGSGVTWSIDSASPSGKFVLSGAQGSQTLTLASSTLAAGADYTVHITASTSATECGVYDNTATLTTTNANNPNPASAEEVCNPAHVTITKTADASPVNAGDPIGFTVEVKNTGTGTAKGVSLNDSLPAGSGSGVTWSIDSASPSGKFVLSGAAGFQSLGLASSTLPAGADYTVHITASTSATECGVYDNTATLTTTNANNPGPASAEEVCNPAHVTITKTADASPVNAGDPIGFTVEVKNTGTGTATGVKLSDSLPGGSGSGVTWSIDSASPSGKFVLSGAQGSQTLSLASSTLAAGADYTVHITASTSATECGVYDNTATLTTTNANNPNPASAEEVCNPAHVTITKTADASPVNAGDPIGFTVEVKNTGTGTATGVKLSDSLPGGSGSGVTWSIDSATPSGKFVLSGAQGSQTLTLASSTLAAGADYTVHITASTSATECGVYDNTATLTTTNANNPNPASAEEVCNPAHVTITKTADASPVNAGDPIGFTVEVKNTGTGTATGVKLSDSLPGGSGSGVTWSIDSATPSGKFVLSGAQGSQTLTLASSTLAAGADYTVHITASTSATECGVYDNTATLTTTNANNPNPASAEEVCNPAHVTITKTADKASVNAGDPIGFTVEVKNTGTGTATGVKLSDSLPGGSGSGVTWSIDSASPSGKFVLSGAQGSQTLSLASNTLPAGADYTVHITASTSATECGVYDNTATLTTTNANNPNPAEAVVTCSKAAIHIVKTADKASVSAGDPIGFTLTVYNSGTGDAKGVTVSDQLPQNAGLSWSIDGQGSGFSTSANPCSINGAGTTLSCGPVTVPAGTTQGASTFTVHITSPTTRDTGGNCPTTGMVNNTGFVTTSNDGSDNSSASVCVNAPAIHIVKTADKASVSAGDPIGFTLTVYNSGTGDAKGVTVSDQLPQNAGLSWSIDGQGSGFSTSANPCSINGAGTTLSCGPVTVPAGTTQGASTFTVHITSPTTRDTGGTCPTTGMVNNTGFVTTSNDGSDNSSASVCVNAPAIHIVKTADKASVSAGDPIGFTLTVSNTGAGDAKGVTVSDQLPQNAGLSWSIDGQGSGFSTSANPCSINGAGTTLSCGPVTVPAGTTQGASTFTVHITSPTTRDTGGTCPTTGVVNNTGFVTTSNDGSDNSSASVCVNAPVIHIVKTADAAQVNQGDPIGFTLTVFNSGAGDAKGVTVTDQLPQHQGLSWSIDQQGSGFSTSANPCSINGAGTTLSCGPVTVPAGTAQGTSTFTVHITSQTGPGSGGLCPTTGVVDNTGVVTTTNDGSDQSKATTCVEGITDLAITKSGSPATQDVLAGSPFQDITWTMVVTNKGPDVDTNVVVGDPTPAGTTYVSSNIDPADGTCTEAANVLTCHLGTMQVGASVTITMVTTPTQEGQLTNTAQVNGDLPESDMTNNQASASVLVTTHHKPPVFCTALIVRPNQLYAGRTTKMHITVINNHHPVRGVRVHIKGPGISTTTAASNSHGKITKRIKPRKAGIVIFRPLVSKASGGACKVPRIGITGVFTPPVTG